ncbi:MAG TPA: MFS transporter [Tepidiformaceae bacterium]|nr:MFS transporter [Tepidiformaceae bacterium]
MKVAAQAALASPVQGSQPAPYRLLVTVALGALLAPLNSTMIAVALPVIRRDFDVGHASAGWLISSYLIAMAVTQPAAGRLGDQLGRERLFRAGLIGFLAFSVAAALAPNFALLLTFRTFQAISGAVLIPNGMGMLRAGAPPDRFGRFSGLTSAAIGATAAAGPLLGGALLLVGSWRLLFLASVPAVAVTLILTMSLPRGASSATRRTTLGIDPLGLALFAGMLCATTLLLNSVRSADGTFTGTAAVAVTLLAALFAWRQRTTAWPTAEWPLFRTLSFAGASSHILLMNLAMYTTLIAVPFFLTDVQQRGAAVAGVLLACMAALQALVAPFAGAAADAHGRRTPTVLSSVVALVAALLLVVGVGRDMSLAYLAVALTILGFGVGVGFVAASVAAVEAAPRALASSAAGTQSMMRYLGSIIGVGVLSGLLNTQGDAPAIGVFRLLFAAVAVMLALSLVAALLVRPFSADRDA